MVNIGIFSIRITVCFILSILIGLERQYRHRVIGLRTNVLVGIGAFLFVSLAFGLPEGSFDETRIAAQVVSGIGFLGAGVILREGSKIKGLNTAATLWCVAAIGVLTAGGFLIEATIGTAFVLLSNICLRYLSKFIMTRIKYDNKEKCTIKITCKKDIEVVVRTSLADALELHNLSLSSLDIDETDKKEVKMKAVIITMRKEIVEDIIKNISAEPGVVSISWTHKKYFQPDSIDSDANDES